MAYDKNIAYNDLPDLPPSDIESLALLRHAINAARQLAELKGLCETMPDPRLLLNSIVLQESRESSAIENIVTTQDELFRAEADKPVEGSPVKEVLRYREAMYAGLKFMEERGNLITTNNLVQIVQTIKNNDAGIRNQPGTQLRSSITGEVIFTPPCCEEIIRNKLKALEQFINTNDTEQIDPLIKMALLHYQFEAIHPFADGNGRTGRILNNLYLVQQNLLPQPVLYLSAYISDNKQDYYQLLRRVTEQGNWSDWILFILTAITTTAQQTTKKIRDMILLKAETEAKMREVLKGSYNQELLHILFTHPYVKIDTLVNKKLAHRQTASGYLKKLTAAGVLTPQKTGKTTYYINQGLTEILSRRS